MHVTVFHVHEVQKAASKLTESNIETAREAAQWLASQWLASTNTEAKFLVGPLTAGSVSTIKAVTSENDTIMSEMELFRKRIEHAAYGPRGSLLPEAEAPHPYTLTVTVDEDLIRKATTTALRATFSTSDRYDSGEGVKAIVAQVNKFARETNYRPLIEKLAPAIIEEAVSSALETAVKAVLRDQLRNMKTTGELATLFDANKRAEPANQFTMAESRNGEDTSLGYATVNYTDTIAQALTTIPKPNRIILHPDGRVLYKSDPTQEKWIKVAQ